MSRYVPPAKRAVTEQVVSLSEDNFPVLASSPSPAKSPMNFKDCFKAPEKPDDSCKTYPGGINPETRAKMISEGWTFLSITATKHRGFCEAWNSRMSAYFGATTITADVCKKPEYVSAEYDSDSDDSYSPYNYMDNSDSDDE